MYENIYLNALTAWTSFKNKQTNLANEVEKNRDTAM